MVNNTTNNPSKKGVKHDQGKTRYDLVPHLAEEQVAQAFTHGADKYNEAYDEENWRKLDYRERRLYGAVRRHIAAAWRGERLDPESGLLHYAHAAASIMMLMQIDLEEQLEEKQ